MSDELKVKVVIAPDDSETAKRLFQTQVQSVVKPIDVQVNFDATKIQNQLKSIISQVKLDPIQVTFDSNITQNAKNASSPIYDTATLKKDQKKYVDVIQKGQQTIDNAIKQASNFKVKKTNTTPQDINKTIRELLASSDEYSDYYIGKTRKKTIAGTDDKLITFQLYNDELKKAIALQYKFNSKESTVQFVSREDITNTKQLLDLQNKLLMTQEKIKAKQYDKFNDFDVKLQKLDSSYSTGGKKVIDVGKLDLIRAKRANITDKLGEHTRNADAIVSARSIADIKKMISEYELLIKVQKEAQYAANKLATGTFSDSQSKALSTFERQVVSLTKFKNISIEAKKEISSIRKAIKLADDSVSLKHATDQFSTLQDKIKTTNNEIKRYSSASEITKAGKMHVADRSKTDPIQNIQKQILAQEGVSKVSVTGKNYFDGQQERLKSFTTTVTYTTGEVKKLGFELSNIGKRKGFVETDSGSVKSTIDLVKKEKEIAALQKQVTSASSGGALEQQFKKADIAIQTLRNDTTGLKAELLGVNSVFKEQQGNISHLLGSKKISNLDENEVKELQLYIRKLNEAERALKNLNSRISTSSRTQSKENAFHADAMALKNLISHMEKSKISNDKMMNNQALSARFDTILKRARTADAGGDVSFVKQLQNDVKSLELELGQAGVAGQRFTTRLGSQMEKLGMYFSASSIMLGVGSAIKSMIQNVKDLDSAMTELKKVTNEADSGYVKFLDNAKVRAQSLGATLTDTVTATADFAKLGYNMSDATKLADSSILYKNIGDGISDISEASASIISTMKAYGIETENVMQIVDRFNETGNKFSITSKGVGDALLRSASSLSSAGNTLEESIGMIVAMNEVIQDPDIVGTAIKTISMRLRNTAGKLDEMGEDSDGAAESITKLQQQIQGLSGVNIMQDENTFKSTYDIVVELSGVWNTLTDKAKADITRLVAGVRQGNAFDALMKNMQTGIQATDTAMNSLGSATKENEVYLESIAGKTARFQEVFESLSETVVNSSLIKGAVDGGSAVLNILDKITSTLGSLPTLISLAVGAFSAIGDKGFVGLKEKQGTLSGKGFDFTQGISDGKEFFKRKSPFEGADKEIQRYNEAIKEAKFSQEDFLKTVKDKGLHNYLSTIVAGEAAMDGYTESLKLTSVSARAAAVSINIVKTAMNMGIAIVAAEAIKGLIYVFDKLITTSEEHKENLTGLKSEYDEITTKLQNMEKEFSSNKDRMDELFELQMDGKLTIYDQEELDKLSAVNSDLAKTIALQKIVQEQKDGEKRKAFVAAMDDDLNDSSEYNVNVNGDIKKGSNTIRGESTKANEKAYLEEQLKLYQEHSNRLQEYKQEQLNKDLADRDHDFADKIKQEEAYLESIKALSFAKLDELSEAAEGIEWIKDPKTDLEKRSNEYLEWINNFSDMLLTTFDGKSQTVLDFEEVINNVKFSNVTENLKALAAQGTLTVDKLQAPAYKEFIDALIQSGFIADNSSESLQKVATAFADLAKKSTNAADSIKESNAPLSTVSSLFGKCEDGLKALNSAMGEFKDDGSVSFSTLSNIQGAFKDVGGIDEYISKLSSAKLTSGELNQVLQDLTISYVGTQMSTEELATANVDLVASMLKEIGVSNYSALANQLVSDAKVRLKIVSFDLANATEADTKAFYVEMQAMGLSENAVNSLRDAYANAQSTMTYVTESGALSRLGILDGELKNIKSIAGAYNLLHGKFGKDMTSTEFGRHLNSNPDMLALMDAASASEKLNNIKLTIPKVNYSGYKGGKLPNSKEHKSKEPKSEKQEGGKTPTELYLVEINKLAEAEENLVNIQEKRSKLEKKISLTDNYKEKVKYLKEVNSNLREQQTSLHEMNNTRDDMIRKNIAEIQAHTKTTLNYNAETNELIVQNMESLNNDVWGKDNEETNKLRKKYEDLIKDTIALNDANKDASLQYYELAESVRETKDAISDELLKPFDDLMQKAEDFDLFGSLKLTKLDLLKNKLEEVNRLWKHGYLSGEKYKNLIHEINKAIYDEKTSSIHKIIDLTKELIKQETENAVDALEDQKEKYSDIVRLKKESLSLAKEENEYQRSLSDKLDAISKIQNQIDELKPDTSRESLAEQKKLEEEKLKLQNELADAQADHAYDAQQDSLDKQQESFESQKDEEIKTIKETIDSAQKLYDLAIKRIDADWDLLYQDLLAYNLKYGDGIAGEDSIKSAWQEAKNVVDQYKVSVAQALALTKQDGAGDGYYSSHVQNLIGQMQQNSQAWHGANQADQENLSSANDAIAKQIESLIGDTLYKDKDGVWRIGSSGGKLYDAGQPNYDDIAYGKVQEMWSNANDWKFVDEKGKSQLVARNEQIATELSKLIGQLYKDQDGVWRFEATGEKLFEKYEIHHKGGTAGDKPTVKQDEVMSKLQKGELILDDRKQEGVFRLFDFATYMTHKFSAALANGFTPFTLPVIPLFDTLKQIVQSDQNSTSTFSPNITVNVSATGTGIDGDKLGNSIANATMKKLNQVMEKGGFSIKNLQLNHT